MHMIVIGRNFEKLWRDIEKTEGIKVPYYGLACGFVGITKKSVVNLIDAILGSERD